METEEIKNLKSKVIIKKIEKLKDTLEAELEESKLKSLELRKVFDQVKSREGIKSLVFKKRLEEAKKNLQESKIVWTSELQNIYNSMEHYKTTQLQKKYSHEKKIEELMSILSPNAIFSTIMENSYNMNEISQKLKFTDENSTLESIFTSCTSPLNITIIKNIENIREKIKNFINPYEKVHNFEGLSSVDENIEISFDANVNYSAIYSKSGIEEENEIEEISLKQPEEEEVEENNTYYDGIGVTTSGDQVITKKDADVSYIIKEDDEIREETLDYTKNDIPIKQKTWKYWICPCIFRRMQR